jgi:hypothetical protein
MENTYVVAKMCLTRQCNLQQWLGKLRVAGVENTDSRHVSNHTIRSTLCRRTLVNFLPDLSPLRILGSQIEMSSQSTLCGFSRQINPSLSLSLFQSKTPNNCVCSTSEFIYTSQDLPLPERVFFAQSSLHTKFQGKKKLYSTHKF